MSKHNFELFLLRLGDFKEKHLKRIVSSASLASDLLGFKLE